jgi:hypothetical protein
VLPLSEIGPVLVDVAFGGDFPWPKAELDAIREVFGISGPIAEPAHGVDWSLMPLGAVSGWSPAMRATVRFTRNRRQACLRIPRPHTRTGLDREHRGRGDLQCPNQPP